MPLVGLLLLPFVGSLVTALLPTRARTVLAELGGARLRRSRRSGSSRCFRSVRDGGVIREEIPWLPSLGLDLVLRIDGFAWMFAMLVTGIGALVVALRALLHVARRSGGALLRVLPGVHGRDARRRALRQPRSSSCFFWELTSLFSFLLIGYWHHRADARRGARMALTVTGAGGLALLGGVVVLGHDRRQLRPRRGPRLRRPGARASRSTRSRWCWSCSARSPRARSSRSTSGCRTRWRRRRRCRPTCTRRPW